ncbi:hypothetical protein TIFTF001_034259 [Ficus carica]|uniref:Uncharacterized protein n=1 Tax=Ficus carica TaxID=3494 RepID=A0AA88J8L4_FICCA|nr:hypothetical protein TIFTF001_034259 [Ficus carica]
MYPKSHLLSQIFSNTKLAPPSLKSTGDSVATPSSELLPSAPPVPRLDALAAAFLGGVVMFRF